MWCEQLCTLEMQPRTSQNISPKESKQSFKKETDGTAKKVQGTQHCKNFPGETSTVTQSWEDTFVFITPSLLTTFPFTHGANHCLVLPRLMLYSAPRNTEHGPSCQVTTMGPSPSHSLSTRKEGSFEPSPSSLPILLGMETPGRELKSLCMRLLCLLCPSTGVNSHRLIQAPLPRIPGTGNAGDAGSFTEQQNPSSKFPGSARAALRYSELSSESPAVMCGAAVPAAPGALPCPGIAATARRFICSPQLAGAELLINVSISYHPQHPISLSFSPAG